MRRTGNIPHLEAEGVMTVSVLFQNRKEFYGTSTPGLAKYFG